MINQTIAYLLKKSLVPLVERGLITRLAGLVKTLETDRFSGGKKKKYRFPIPVEASESTCLSTGRVYPDLVPDSSERLIVYFEDGGATCLNGDTKWQSRLRLVAWGNRDGFTIAEERQPELPIIIASLLIGAIRKATGEGIVNSLRVEITSSPEAGANLFSRYTYNETSSQYLMLPYFALGLDLTIIFTLQHDCAVNNLIAVAD